MKKQHWFALAFLVMAPAMALIQGCGGDDGGDDNGGGGVDIVGLDCTGDDCILSGTITQDVTLTANKRYLLRGGVFIGNDASRTVLTIEPGTKIVGEQSTAGFLCIRRGSQLVANGTKEAPIVFTSSLAAGARSRGDWGGIIINGRAPINTGTEAFGEGGTGFYGGTDPADNSGSLRYVRVEFAGRIISPENELNGIAFQGVGSGTTVEYVQVHMNKDDGIEFFGGTVNAKYLLTTGIADDSFDWTDGWVGKGQFWLAQQYDDDSDNGIEADNNAENQTATPRSMPTLSNVTLIGSPTSSASDIGMLLRAGTGARIWNSIVQGFNEAGIDIDNTDTFTQSYDGDPANGNLNGSLVVRNSIFWGDGRPEFKNDASEPTTDELFITRDNVGNTVENPLLGNAYDVSNPDWRPATGSPAASGAASVGDSWFTNVSFRGAVDPANDWTKGWTISARN